MRHNRVEWKHKYEKKNVRCKSKILTTQMKKSLYAGLTGALHYNVKDIFPCAQIWQYQISDKKWQIIKLDTAVCSS